MRSNMLLLTGIPSEGGLINGRALDSLREGKRMVEAKYQIVRNEVSYLQV